MDFSRDRSPDASVLRFAGAPLGAPAASRRMIRSRTPLWMLPMSPSAGAPAEAEPTQEELTKTHAKAGRVAAGRQLT